MSPTEAIDLLPNLIIISGIWRKSIACLPFNPVTPVEDGIEIKVHVRKGKYDPGRQKIEFRVYGMNPDSTIMISGPNGDLIPCPAGIYDPDRKVWLVEVSGDAKEKKIRIRNP